MCLCEGVCGLISLVNVVTRAPRSQQIFHLDTHARGKRPNWTSILRLCSGFCVVVLPNEGVCVCVRECAKPHQTLWCRIMHIDTNSSADILTPITIMCIPLNCRHHQIRRRTRLGCPTLLRSSTKRSYIFYADRWCCTWSPFRLSIVIRLAAKHSGPKFTALEWRTGVVNAT